MNRIGAGLRAAAVVFAAAPLFAGCASMLDDQTIGTRGAPSAGAEFAVVANIGTSLSAGFESGGISDSTQQEGPMYQLALGMGLTPGVNWFYPSLLEPGCPAPYTNPLTGARVGGATATGCVTRDRTSARPYMSDVAIPGLRAAQAIDVTRVDFPATDTLKLTQFITGGMSPLTMAMRQHPTFVTVEVGANDVLGGATRGDTTLLTSAASYTASITAIADSLDSLNPKPGVAIANVPNVTAIPFFTRASVLFCLKTGACPGVPATLPYSSPLFTVDVSCAPNAAGGIGDTYLLTFPATATVTAVLAGGGAGNLNCATDVATVTTAAGTGPAGATINSVEYAAITARVAAFNAAVSSLATARGYALVDLDATLAGQAAQVPPIPLFTTPSALFGPLFSLDGVHPSKAGYKLLAQAFATAINAKYGTTITVP